MAILTKAGRVAIATAIKAQAMHLAWGPGDGAWTTPPSEEASASAITNEIGRRLVNSCDYVVPDSNGSIEIAGLGKFSTTTTPTNQLFVVTTFDFADAATSTIRQLGLFVGATVQAGLPAGQRYFTPAQITAPGTLLQLENRAPVPRTSSTRERFEILITF